MLYEGDYVEFAPAEKERPKWWPVLDILGALIIVALIFLGTYLTDKFHHVPAILCGVVALLTFSWLLRRRIRREPGE